jgi:plastocyanin
MAVDNGWFAMRRLVVVLLVCGVVVATGLAGLSSAGTQLPKGLGVTTNVTVHMTEYHFQLSRTSAPVGTVVFTVVNEGMDVHNFSIAGKTTPYIQAGESATLTVNFTSAGSRPYLCTIGTHAADGMQGTFTISGSTGTSKLTAVLNASEKEWKISLTTLAGARVRSVKHGLIRFKVRNAGHLPHNFAIARKSTLVLNHAKRAVLNVVLKPGRYRYVCSVKGHAALGMQGVLVVT